MDYTSFYTHPLRQEKKDTERTVLLEVFKNLIGYRSENNFVGLWKYLCSSSRLLERQNILLIVFKFSTQLF